MQRIISGLATLLLVIGAEAAHASIVPIGSAFILTGTNAPNTYTTTTTFGGTESVDSGAESLTMSQVATGPNGEWDIWSLSTTAGGPIGNINAFWSIAMDYVLSQPVFFDQVVNQWTFNGSPVSPINNFGGICCAVSNNPATGGEAYYNSGFSIPIAAGTYNDWTQIYINPYEYAFTGGGIPEDADGFTWALHFTLQNPTATPIPAALPLFASGLGGLGLFGWRRKRKKTAVINV